MYAIVKAGGHQEKVEVGDVILVNRLEAKKGETVEFPVALVVDGAKEKTMIYQKLAQLVKEVLPFVRCIRLVLEQIIIIGINYIGS